MSILLKRSVGIVLLCLAVLLIGSSRADAQQITWQVVGSGATTTSGGAITLMGTVGQTAIGTVEGGTTTAYLGFWVPLSSVSSVPTPGDVTSTSTLKNFPNPFNTTTTLYYEVPERSMVRVRIFDLSGQLVKELVDGVQESGSKEITWDGTDERGMEAASGTYYYSMDAQPVGSAGAPVSQRNKMLLMR